MSIQLFSITEQKGCPSSVCRTEHPMCLLLAAVGSVESASTCQLYLYWGLYVPCLIACTSQKLNECSTTVRYLLQQAVALFEQERVSQ